MANTHLNTAYQAGVQQALEEEGYKTAADLEKDVHELGLLNSQPAPEKVATSDAQAIADLKAKIGK